MRRALRVRALFKLTLACFVDSCQLEIAAFSVVPMDSM